MKRSVGVKWGKLQVGLLIMFVVIILIWSSFGGSGTSLFESKGKFVCYFDNVDGLVRGSPIWMSGLEIGNVTSLGLKLIDEKRMVEVKCRVKKEIWPSVTEDARARLGTIGFLGDKYIEILPGTANKPPLAEGAVMQTQHIGNAPDMFKAGEEAFDNAGSVVANLDTLLARVKDGTGTLGKLSTDSALYTEMTKLLTSLTKLSADLQKNQDRLVSSVEHMATSVGELSDQVNENKGTIGKLITDPALYNNLNATTARLDSVLTKIDRAQGNVGLLVNDTALYVELAELLARANNLMTDIEKNPRKYFKFSVF